MEVMALCLQEGAFGSPRNTPDPNFTFFPLQTQMICNDCLKCCAKKGSEKRVLEVMSNICLCT